MDETRVQSRRWHVSFEFVPGSSRVVIDQVRPGGEIARRSEYVVKESGGWVEHSTSENDGGERKSHRQVLAGGVTVDSLMRSEFDLMVSMIDLRAGWTLTQDPRGLWEIAESPTTELGVSDDDAADGTRRIDIGFDPAGRAAAQNSSRRTAEVECEPSRGWRVIRSRTTWSDIDSRMVAGYAADASHPFPERVETVTQTAGAEVYTSFRLLRVAAYERLELSGADGVVASIDGESDRAFRRWLVWSGAGCVAFGTLLVARAATKRRGV